MGGNKFTSESLNPISYRLLNAVPNQLSERAFPIATETDMETQSGPLRAGQVVHSSPHGGVRPSLQLRVGRLARPEFGAAPLTPTRNLTFPGSTGFLTWPRPHRTSARPTTSSATQDRREDEPDKYLENASAGGPIFTDPNPITRLSPARRDRGPTVIAITCRSAIC